MANFVLVHGAWHGGWCWRDTAAALRSAGHTVHTPTLTGVGDKFHLSHQAITLETHIRDVVGCIEAEELTDVVLCGHSYGGMVITGTADRLPGRIAAMMYLDAFVPEDGDSLIDLLQQSLAPEVAAQFVGGFRASAREGGSGMMAPIPAAVFGIAEQNQAWVERRCVPQPLATFEMPLLLAGGGGSSVGRRSYLLADGWDPSPFRHFARKFTGQPGWEVTTLDCGHDVMVDLPQELAKALIALA